MFLVTRSQLDFRSMMRPIPALHLYSTARLRGFSISAATVNRYVHAELACYPEASP
jgi:hypothetical protein